MKHRVVEDVNVKGRLDIDFVKEDVEDVIDKITHSAVTIVAAVTVAQILRKWLT